MEKIKHFITTEKGKDIITVLIIIFVGLGSFGLGRMSRYSAQNGLIVENAPTDGHITIEKPVISDFSASVNTSISQAQSVNTNTDGKKYFASSRGTKYYTISCSAGKTIKQENRIYWSTREEAEQAGYTLSSSCN